MSYDAGSVSTTLRLATGPFDRALAGASSSLDRLARRLAFPLPLATQWGASLVGEMAGVAQKAADVETSMMKLRRVTTLSDQAFNKLGNEIKDTSTLMAGVNFSDAMGVATFAAKMGIADNQLGMFTRDVLQFSQVVDDMGAEELATRLARLGTVFGTNATETRQWAAALAALDNQSTATASEILNITTRVAGFAKLMKMTPQQTMALAATTREAGVNPEVAGTALLQVFKKMYLPKSSRQMAKIAGLDNEEFAQMADRDPGKALSAVTKGLKGMSLTEASEALDELKLRGAGATQTLLGLANAADKQAQFLGVANREWDTLATLQRNVGLNAETFNAQWMRVSSSFEVTSASLGQALLPAMKALADGLVRLMADIRATIERNKETFAGWGLKLAEVMSKVGLLWREFPTVLEFAGEVAGEKLDQFLVVASRFNIALVDNMKWAATSITQIFVQAFGGLGTVLSDLMTKNIRHMIEAAKAALLLSAPWLAKQLGIKDFDPAAAFHQPKANWGLMGDINQGVAAPPGFPGLFNNLPNREAQKGPLWARLQAADARAKADQAGQLGGLMAGDEAARNGAAMMGLAGNVGMGGVAGMMEPVKLTRAQQRRAAEEARIKAIHDARRRDQRHRLGHLLPGFDDGPPGGPDLVKPGEAVGAAMGNPQATLKKSEEALDALKGILRGIEDLKRDGMPIMA